VNESFTQRQHGDELPRMRTAPPGPRSQEMAARLAAVESPAFDARRHARALASGELFAPIVYAEAHGANVVDVDGNLYVDLTAGFGAVLLGHRAQPVDDAVRRGMNTAPLALGDVYPSVAKVQLLEKLAALYPKPGASA
jgi:4-aminobutyrate aminotransferase/(S)-3-amino-2-methylpropionate transaminase